MSDAGKSRFRPLVGFSDSHRDRFGAEPVSAVLEMPSSNHYAAKKREREASARRVRDEWLEKEIMRVRADKNIGRRGPLDEERAVPGGAEPATRLKGGAVHPTANAPERVSGTPAIARGR